MKNLFKHAKLKRLLSKSFPSKKISIIDNKDEQKIFNKLDSWQRRYYMFQIYHHHDYNPSYDDILKINIENIC